MQAYEQAITRLATADRLDQIRMSPNERRTARGYLRQAELIANMPVSKARGTLIRQASWLRH
jgi:hypothetical protein